MRRLTGMTLGVTMTFVLGCLGGGASYEDPRGDWFGICYLDGHEFDLELHIGGKRAEPEGFAILSQPEGVRYPGELVFDVQGYESDFPRARYEVDVDGTLFVVELRGTLSGEELYGSCSLEWDSDYARGDMLLERD